MISEGLRYMSLPSTSRFCTETYKIPDSDFTVPKGMKVIIPTVSQVEIDSINVLNQAGLHFDPEYWSHPDEFDPDRFSLENRNNLVSGAYQPFGFGPK